MIRSLLAVWLLAEVIAYVLFFMFLFVKKSLLLLIDSLSDTDKGFNNSLLHDKLQFCLT